MNLTQLESLDIFLGAASPAEARVYARTEIANLPQHKLHLTGRLSGPTCEFARTLAAHIPFTDRSQGKMVLAEAVVPDPCFWTPELPFLYRAHLELHDGEQIVAGADQLFGIRRLAIRDRALHFDGKRFVLRGVRMQPAASEIDSAAAFARETWTALVVPNPSDEFCEFASRHGVLLAADLIGTDAAGLESQILRLARWPAVGIALLDSGTSLPANVRDLAPNLLLAEYFLHNHPLRPSSWAQLAFVEIKTPSKGDQSFVCENLPIVAVRSSPQPTTVEQARAACDRLQSDLTSHGQFAGYIV